MTVVPVQVQLGGQFGLVEHDNVRSLLTDEPVQVPLLLLRIDASHIPHQCRQGDLGDVQVSTGCLSKLLGVTLGVRSLWSTLLPVTELVVPISLLLVIVPWGCDLSLVV